MILDFESQCHSSLLSTTTGLQRALRMSGMGSKYLRLGSRRTRASTGNKASEDRRICKNVIGLSGEFSFRTRIYIGQTSWNLCGMSKPSLFQEIACARVRQCSRLFKSQHAHPIRVQDILITYRS
jgi:hypothetical protein